MKRTSACLLSVLLGIGMIAGCAQQNTEQSSSAVSSISSAPSGQEQESTSDASAAEASDNQESQSASTNPDLVSNFVIEVLDKSQKKLGQFQQSGGAVVTDKDIFYSAAQTDAQNQKVTEYHLYLPDENKPEENKDVLLGSIKDLSYEATYARTELGSKEYTLVMTGNLMDSEKDPLWLLEFDLDKHSMQKYQISNNGFAYTAMAAANGKLLIINHDQELNLTDRLYEFDPATCGIRQVMSFELNELIGDTLRQVYSDGSRIYLLRLHFDEESNVRMFVDTYDMDYKKLDERDITLLMVKANANMLMADEVFNEMKQMVSRFIIFNKDCIYYENFSATHFLGSLTSLELLDESSEAVCASFGSGTPFFFNHELLKTSSNSSEEQSEQEKQEEEESAAEQEKELPYYFEWAGDGFSQYPMTFSDSRYYIDSGSRSQNGSLMLQTSSFDPERKENPLPLQIYYYPAK